ncbi:hypothetical protein HDU84_003851 [Entophlyctis sp. JEL0112]|nr:hypothetical protein HDU84_003851 [Entophlyctis sp. JEL0112]
MGNKQSRALRKSRNPAAAPQAASTSAPAVAQPTIPATTTAEPTAAPVTAADAVTTTDASQPASAPKKPHIYVVIHSMWGHIKTLADEIVAGIEAEGAKATLWRVDETLPKEVLEKMWAKSFEEIPPDDLTNADGFIFGFGTRYGAAPAQIKTFWDSTGQLWSKGALVGKFGAVFTSTATQHGGQEQTIATFVYHYVHHGILFVPLGYTNPLLNDNTEIIGGGPWGAGTLSNGDGSRQVSEKEKQIAKHQGQHFAKTVAKAL